MLPWIDESLFFCMALAGPVRLHDKKYDDLTGIVSCIWLQLQDLELDLELHHRVQVGCMYSRLV